MWTFGAVPYVSDYEEEVDRDKWTVYEGWVEQFKKQSLSVLLKNMEVNRNS